jgi:hypothetical protein
MFDSWENHETSQSKQVWCKCGDGINPDSGAICGNCLASMNTIPQTKPLSFQDFVDLTNDVEAIWDFKVNGSVYFPTVDAFNNFCRAIEERHGIK